MMTDVAFDSEQLWRNLHFDNSEIHCKNSERAIVVFSGGFDSTIALWWAMFHYKKLRVIIVDYNQTHKEEISHARRIAALAGIDIDLIKLDIPLDFWGINNNLTRGQAGLMTSIAALDISTAGADIVHGILRTDTYPDCDREYLDTLAGILPNTRDVGEIGIATPLRAIKDKQTACLLGFLYGAPMKWTWSCRTPINGRPCEKCSPCQARREIWNLMEERYGLSFEEIDSWQTVLGSPIQPSFREPSHELYVLIQAFIEMGGLKHCERGWKYIGPDGKKRFATWIRNPEALAFDVRSFGEVCKYVEIHGEFVNGLWWQIVICEDQSIAYTDCIPDITVIEQSLKDKLVNSTFGDL